MNSRDPFEPATFPRWWNKPLSDASVCNYQLTTKKVLRQIAGGGYRTFELKPVADAGMFSHADDKRRTLDRAVGIARNFRRRRSRRQRSQEYCAVCGWYFQCWCSFERNTFVFSPDTLIHAADLLDVLYLHDTASLDFTVSGYAAEQTFITITHDITPQ